MHKRIVFEYSFDEAGNSQVETNQSEDFRNQVKKKKVQIFPNNKNITIS